MAPGAAPVTVNQLLTHTAGFDDRVVGMFSRDASDVLPLGEYLSHKMPPRTTTPGRWSRYNNHGAALAGLMVAEAAEKPFDEAIASLILEPLGMHSTTFAQPIPPALRDRLARTYSCADARCDPMPIDYRHTTPAGAMVTTPDDMSVFIRSVLYANSDPMSAPVVHALFTRIWSGHPDLPGMALAFQEQFIGGFRALVHAGNSSGYTSMLAKVPEANAGLFVVTTRGSTRFGASILALFEAQFNTADTDADAHTPARAVPLTASESAEYVGVYLSGRAPRNSYESFPALFLFNHMLDVDSAGYRLRREGAATARYGRVDGDLFRDIEGPGMLAFERDASGQVVGMLASEVFHGVRFPGSYRRLAVWQTPRFINEGLSWVIGLPVTVMLVWLATTGWDLARRKSSYGRTIGGWIGILVAIVSLTQILVFGFGFIAKFNAFAASRPMELAYGLPDQFARLLWLPWSIAITTVLLLGLAVAAYWRSETALRDRLLLTVVGTCSALFVLLLVQFSMLPPVA